MLVSNDYTQSGKTLYGIIYNSANQVANGVGFETYTAPNRGTYAISAPEGSIPKHYTLTVPSYILAGDYSVTFYLQSGGSPAATDTPVGAENFTVPVSTPAPTVPTDLISQLRILANDTPTSNLITQETPKGVLNGVNTNYRFQYQNIITGSVYLTSGATFRTQSGFTIDTANGILTMGSAPAGGTDPFEVDYNFNWFTDTDYAEFLVEAAKEVLSITNPALVPDGLVPSLLKFGVHYFWLRRASQYAHKYQSSGGQAGQNVDIVTTNFRNLAKDARASALSMRADYYQNQSRNLNPAVAVVNVSMDPFSPRR